MSVCKTECKNGGKLKQRKRDWKESDLQESPVAQGSSHQWGDRGEKRGEQEGAFGSEQKSSKCNVSLGAQPKRGLGKCHYLFVCTLHL